MNSQDSTCPLPASLATTILGKLPDPVIVSNSNGGIIYANARARSLLCASGRELLGQPLGTVAPELVGASWKAFVTRLRSTGTAAIACYLCATDEQRFSAELSVELMQHESEEFCVLIARHLRERGSISALQQFGQFVIENLPDPVYWIRRDGSFMYVNAAASRMLGYTRLELMDLSILDVNRGVDAERWEMAWQALLAQGQRVFRSKHVAKDGSDIDVEVSASVYTYEGETFSCAFAKDDREQRKTDEALKREHAFVESLITTAPVIILVLDAEGRVDRINRCAEMTTGYRIDELRGKAWVETLVPASEQAHVISLLGQSYAGATMRGIVYPLITKQGIERLVLWHDQLLTHPESGALALLAIGQDITEQRHLEQRLHQAEKLEAIGRLAGGIAHDFNNQLAGIMGWTEILRYEVNNPTVVQECVERIMTALKRSSDLTAQLLAYARKGKYVAKVVDLHDVVREVVGILRPRIGRKFNVELDLGAELSTTIGDPSQLGNAVLNLAINSCDAMQSGGTLRFETRVMELGADEVSKSPYEVEPGRFVELAVSDTGTGMDEHTQRHMFEPFFTTKAEGSGTGMGLAAVYGTVKSHRGIIAVSSAPGRGTSMRIQLPVAQPLKECSTSESSSASIPKTAIRVLLVDDEAVVRNVTVRLLQRLGCQVTSFDNGFDAIKHYRDAWQATDVVILDMVMPMLDGKSTYRELKAINPDVRVVLASGYSVDGDAQRLLNEGAIEFVQKPFQLAALKAALDSARNATHSLTKMQLRADREQPNRTKSE